MCTETNHHNNIREAFAVLLRYRWRFALPAFLAMAGVLIVSLLLPRKYQAEAIFERRTDLVLSEMNSKGAPQLQSPRGSITQELTGETAVEQLVKQLRAEHIEGKAPRLIDQTVNDLRHDLPKSVMVRYDVSNNELDRATVSYVSTDPEMARLIVNKLVENYILRARSVMEKRLAQSATFFEDEVVRERKQIEELENKLLKFEIAHSELLPDSATSLQATLTESQNRLSAEDQALKAAVLNEESLRKSLEQTPKVTPMIVKGPNPELTRLDTELRKAEASLTEAVTVLKMKERHPDLVAMRQRIKSLKAEITHAEPEVVLQRHLSENPHYAELQTALLHAASEREALEAQVTATRKRADELNAQAAGLFPVRSDYRRITREVDQHQRQLAFWEDNLRRVRLAVTAENGNRGIQLDFIKPCPVLDRPVSPNLSQVLLAAVGIGLLSGIASVFFAHRADETFTSGEELAKAFQVPLMGSVSEIISAHQRRLRSIRNFVLYPLNAAAMLAVLAILSGVLYMELEHPSRQGKTAAGSPQPLNNGQAMNTVSGTAMAAKPQD
ncbi:MAG: hypothetical protein K8S99_01265 [Planctomycetes bacterium]|nr:hypothetical protein [Planctomycetota bacterium]